MMSKSGNIRVIKNILNQKSKSVNSSDITPYNELSEDIFITDSMAKVTKKERILSRISNSPHIVYT